MPRRTNVTSFKPGNKLQASMTRGPNGRFVARVSEPETVVHFPVAHEPHPPLQWTDCEPPTDTLVLYEHMRVPQLQYPQIGHDKDEASSIDVLVGVGACLGSAVIVLGVVALLGRVAGWW